MGSENCLHWLQWDCFGLAWPPAEQHTGFHSLPVPGAMGDRIGKKAKLVDWDKESLIGQKRKGEKIEYTKQVMHNAIAHSRWLISSQSPSSRHPWDNSPQFICSAWRHMVRNIPLVSLGQLPWLYPFPASCASPASLLAGQYEKLKSPWLRVSTAQEELKHQHVINIILIPSPKHSTISSTRKKINSIPAETRRGTQQNQANSSLHSRS